MNFQEPMTALNPPRAIGDQIGEMFRIHAEQVRHPIAVMTDGEVVECSPLAQAFRVRRHPNRRYLRAAVPGRHFKTARQDGSRESL